MADVLIVCVREDEPQAKALADMFEAAGFSIGGAPTNDGALRSSGAGVIVWSRSSIRSRPFLDAAQRVVNAGKGVVASLIEPPPPSSVGDSATFDLSSWNGDAEDPQLDPLFFAVDRMVNNARAAVGAPAAEPAPQSFEPPPSLRPPPAAPPQRAAPLRPAPQSPPAMPNLFSNRAREGGLNSEAEHWRAIRDSKNPADFMDYIARYGADGAFAEVAELKLKQLTGGSTSASPTRAAPLRDAARSAAVEPPRQRSYEPPPQPTRRIEPPQSRRAEAPPPQRRPDPPPPRREAPNYERYDRPPVDTREPAKSGGGAMRGLLILGLLAGGAVAAGLYFGNGDQAAQNEDLPPAAISEPADATADGSEGTPEGVGLSDVAEQPPVRATPQRSQQQTASRNEQRERPTTRQQQPQQTRATEEAAPTPAPVTSWNQASGPVSLTPGAPNNSAPGANVPLAPPITAPPPTQVAENRTPAAATPAAAPTVSWNLRPSANRIAELYPARALREGVGGRVVLDCVVQPSLSVACQIASETPGGLGFGRAALTAAGAYRAVSTRSDGSAAVGARARLAITFRPPE
jgi:protein TonB